MSNSIELSIYYAKLYHCINLNPQTLEVKLFLIYDCLNDFILLVLSDFTLTDFSFTRHCCVVYVPKQIYGTKE